MSHAIAFAIEIKAESGRYAVVGQLRPSHGLPAVVLKMLDDFDKNCSLGEVCARAQISVSKGLAIVKKLSQMGILQPRPEASQSPSLSQTRLRAVPSAFSPEEEAFFASEVRPIDECDEPFMSLGDRVELLFSELMLKLRGSPAV